MFAKKSTERVAQLFFQQPHSSFHLREIARKTEMSASTASHAIDELEERELVTVTKKVTKRVEASNNQEFRDRKRVYNLHQLLASGLIDKLEQNYHPDALVLFGSYARGEDASDSDIDLAIINGRQQETELKKWEQKLNRSINLHQVRLQEAGDNFKSTLANGIVVRGYLDL